MRADLEAKAKEAGIEFTDKTTDKQLSDALMKAGLDAQESTPEQTGARFAEPRGEARFVPVDDEEPEFKPDPKQDKMKTTSKPKVKLFPVKLLRNYRPISSDAQIQGDNGEYRPLTDEEGMKVLAGSHVALPTDEAKSVIEKKIAERNDPIA
jgi:hypothetical protein